MAVASCGVVLAATGGGAPARHLDALQRAARSCEAAGVELLLIDGRAHVEGAALEPFSILGALAAETSALCLGALVDASERAPSVVAKATSTLDVCSEGRAVLVLASSGAAGEGLLAECVAVARAMLAEPSPTLEGRHVAVHGAWNEPRAFASPPPVAAAVAAASPEDAGRFVATWSPPPAFVLAEDAGGSAPLEAPRAGSDGFARIPVLHVVGSVPRPGESRRGGFDGIVLRFDDPGSATGDVLERLREATSDGTS